MKTICFLLPLVMVSLSIRAETGFDIRNKAEFRRAVPEGSELRKLAGGFVFAEGPVWSSAQDCLVFSDIPANVMKKWTAAQGVATFRQPSNNSNGNTRDLHDALITCEHTGRRVSIQPPGGELTTLVDRYNGRKLNSPNDAVVKSDGTIWFTDPPYGIQPSQQEQPANYVFRFDPRDKSLTVVAEDFDRPNGLCFSPDEAKLYIADSGAPHHIRVFDVRSGTTLKNGKIFCVIDKGLPDGIRCDREGRVWSSAGDGVQIFNPSGELIGKILVPEPPSNLCFGGKDHKTLYITAVTSLYAIEVSGVGLR